MRQVLLLLVCLQGVPRATFAAGAFVPSTAMRAAANAAVALQNEKTGKALELVEVVSGDKRKMAQPSGLRSPQDDWEVRGVNIDWPMHSETCRACVLPFVHSWS